MGARYPFRLDLFGEIIEGIRLFDPETQRSAESTTTISLLPAREFPITSESIDLFRQNFRRLFEGDPQQQQIYRDFSRGNPSQGIDYYFPLFFEPTWGNNKEQRIFSSGNNKEQRSCPSEL